MLGKFQSKLVALWCSLAHKSIMWPVHGHYECRACGRKYPAFAEELVPAYANRPASQRAAHAALSRAGYGPWTE